jgi:enoyl-CoA hydratase
MPAGLLIDDTAPQVRVITLDRPQRLNALDGPTLASLQAAVRECDEPARDKRVIIVCGAGRAFCSGSDLKWLADSGVLDDPAAHLNNQDRMAAAFDAIETSRCIVIACVHGFAVAGGLELALACDLIVAQDDAQLGDEHIRKCLLPSGGSSQRLPRRIGLARAMYYLVSGRRMNGVEAERIGLACMAVPAHGLKAATMQLAREIAAADTHALAAMKSLARRALEMPLRYRHESPSLLHNVRCFAAGEAVRNENPR